MRLPKMMAGPVCLWLPRLPLGIGACFNFVEASERLSRMGTTWGKHTSGVHGLKWEAYVVCWSGFPMQDVYQFESP
jgi:hypothetical protein